MTLSNTISSKFTNKPVTVSALVTGKADATYTTPLELLLSCSNGCKNSKGCHSKGKQHVTIDAGHSIRFVDLSDFYFKRTIQSIFGMECAKFSYSVEKSQSLTRIFITDVDRKENKTFTCYVIGDSVEVNRSYEFSGTVVADPRTQTATCVFHSAKLIPSSIESFSITKESHVRLNEFCFRGNSEQTMMHLAELYKSYAANVTHIYDRFDLHMACDLPFHSPLSFIFDGEPVNAWLDVAVIGDSRCGKNDVAIDGYMAHYGVGEKVSADTANLTGLIGGLHRVRGDWQVKWGAIPRNDGKLLIVDEALKLPPALWLHLDSIRSEGIAEINKIQSYSTQARTRKIFLLNPPKNVSQYAHGIQSIMDVVKAPQNVTRFDYVLVVSKDEADVTSINTARRNVPVMHSKELDRLLINWIWSRKQNEVVFTEKAVEKNYLMSLDLANTYSFDVPLIQGENIRYKLAKIAACFAARLYSNKNKGKYLLVDSQHVECAWMFLTMIYKKPASSYYALSKIKKAHEFSQGKDGISAIDFYFQAFPTQRTPILQSLLMNNAITMSDICEQTGLPKDISLEIISKLARFKLIERRGFSYVKTEPFTSWLRDEITGAIA